MESQSHELNCIITGVYYDNKNDIKTYTCSVKDSDEYVQVGIVHISDVEAKKGDKIHLVFSEISEHIDIENGKITIVVWFAVKRYAEVLIKRFYVFNGSLEIFRYPHTALTNGDGKFFQMILDPFSGMFYVVHNIAPVVGQTGITKYRCITH